MLWLWCRPVATAPIKPLAWESPYALGAAQKLAKRQKKKKKKKKKNILRDTEGHYIMIKGSIQEEDITILNIYGPNLGSPHYIRQLFTTLKGQLTNNTITAGKL